MALSAWGREEAREATQLLEVDELTSADGLASVDGYAPVHEITASRARGMCGRQGAICSLGLLALGLVCLSHFTKTVVQVGFARDSLQQKTQKHSEISHHEETVEDWQAQRDANLEKLAKALNHSLEHGHKYRMAECSGEHQNCGKTGCCTAAGNRCYKKAGAWAACRASCIPEAPDPLDMNKDAWHCKELGPVSPGEAKPSFTGGAAPWVHAHCAAGGENCTESRCCQEAGNRCYLKRHATTGADDGKAWAACKPECFAGPDPVDPDSHPWDCTALGYATPGALAGDVFAVTAEWVKDNCSDRDENCWDSGCCKDPGHQCFTRDHGFAKCMDSCTAGPLLTQPTHEVWNCTPLGGRTPGAPKVDKRKIAPWVETECAAPETNCLESRCCRNATMMCFEKNDTFAECGTTCPGGSCKSLGPRTPRPYGTPSLYCFSVFLVWSYEADIIRSQINTDGGIGIFACDEQDVFSTDGETRMGQGPNGEVISVHFQNAAVGRTIDGTAGNTRLFINAWTQVNAVGKWKLTDWTVKADPDAVIMPDRLRWHLHNVWKGPKFVLNCEKSGMGSRMFGSLEAISKEAISGYFTNMNKCWNLPVDAFGEDRWLENCMYSVGATNTADFGLVSDGLCYGLNCFSGAAAFHPLKSADAWLGCYRNAVNR